MTLEPGRPVGMDQAPDLPEVNGIGAGNAVGVGERAAPRPDHVENRAGREPGELVLAMSPRQILGGFALLAGLILLLRRRRSKD